MRFSPHPTGRTVWRTNDPTSPAGPPSLWESTSTKSTATWAADRTRHLRCRMHPNCPRQADRSSPLNCNALDISPSVAAHRPWSNEISAQIDGKSSHSILDNTSAAIRAQGASDCAGLPGFDLMGTSAVPSQRQWAIVATATATKARRWCGETS